MSTTPRRKARAVRFNDEGEALAEVARLRRGYVRHGNWSLPQALWHVSAIVEQTLKPAAPGAVATPEQAGRKAGFVDPILLAARKGEAPAGPPMDAPPPFVPAATVGDDGVALFEREFARLRDFPDPVTQMGPFGPVALDEVRTTHLYHLAHHLSFFEPAPATRREGLRYESEEEVIADVTRLRAGYAQTGNWSLSQVCWHLATALRSRMNPGPHPDDTPEQKARRPMFEQVLATGRLPDGLSAPDAFLPPAHPEGDPIAAFFETLGQFRAYEGPMTPHRLFGTLTREEWRRMARIHCAHHLSYLVPLDASKAPSPGR